MHGIDDIDIGYELAEQRYTQELERLKADLSTLRNVVEPLMSRLGVDYLGLVLSEVSNLISERDTLQKKLKEAKPWACWIEGGGIQLEWKVGDRELEIELWEESLTLLTQEGEGRIDVEEIVSIDTATATRVQELFNWVFDEKEEPCQK